MFQSLLSWISRIGEADVFDGLAGGMVFQSLLSWISRIGDSEAGANVMSSSSFNPCCLGLAVLGPGSGWGQSWVVPVSILVVLD